jgi:signal transduction histidine kinase
MPRGVKALIRGGESVTRTAGGSGIGLLTVREIVKDLKGSISMDSRLGEGTKVILDLPGPETTEK